MFRPNRAPEFSSQVFCLAAAPVRKIFTSYLGLIVVIPSLFPRVGVKQHLVVLGTQEILASLNLPWRT